MTTRRFILRLLLCLGLGLATTTIIAWYGALFAPICGGPRLAGTTSVSWSGQVQRFDVPEYSESSSTHTLDAQRTDRPGITSRGDGPRGSSFAWETFATERYQAGWPLAALGWTALAHEKTVYTEPAATITFTRNAAETGLAAWSPWGKVQPFRRLPTAPLGVGMLVDTLTFALIWWAILFAPRALRRHLRLRRGHCPNCNYNLAGLPPNSPCPECGHVSASAASTNANS